MQDFLSSIMQDPVIKAAISALSPKQNTTPTSGMGDDQSASLTTPIAIQQGQKAVANATPIINSNGGHAVQQLVNAGNNIASGYGSEISDVAKASPLGYLPGVQHDPNFSQEQQQGSEIAMSPYSLTDPLAGATAETGAMGVEAGLPAITSDIKDTLATAQAQPGGLQAGFLNPDEFVHPGNTPQGVTAPITDSSGNVVINRQTSDQALGDQPAGTTVQFNKDGTEDVIPPGQRTNPTQYAQTADEGPSISNEDVVPGEPGQTPPKPPFNPNGYQKPQNPMIPSTKVNQADNMKYQSVFQVPSAVVSKMSIKPEQVVNTLVHDGVTGVTLDDLEHVAGEVTGGSGAMANINNYLLSKVPTMVSYSDAATTADSGLDDLLEGEPTGLITQVKREIGAAFKPVQYENTPAEMPNNTAWAQDLFNVSQNLGDTASLFEKRSLDVNGDLKNPEYGRAADAVLQIKAKIDSAIDGATKENYQAYKNDPYVQSQLQRVPGPLAQRFLDNANKFKDGQTVQAPYVQLSKILRYTKDKKLAPFTQAIDESRGKLPSVKAQQTAENIATGVTNPFKGIPQIIGKVAGKVAGQYDPAAEDIDRQLTTPSNTSEQSAQMGFYPKGGAPEIKGKPVGKGVKTAAAVAALGLAGGTGALINGATHPSNAEGNNGAADSQDNHGATISQYNKPVKWNSLPTDTTKLVPDSSGLFSAPSPAMVTGKDGKPLAYMDDASFNIIQQKALDLSNKFNLQVQQEYQQAKVANTQYDQLMGNYSTYVQLNNTIANAMDDLKDAPPNILQQAKTIQGLQTIFNGKYKKAAEALQILDQVYPTDVKGIFGSADMNAANGTFSAMSQDLTGKYMAKINQFTGNLPEASGANNQGLPPPTDNGLQSLPATSGNYTEHGTPQPFVY